MPGDSSRRGNLDRNNAVLEERIRLVAAAFPYPPVPDLSSGVRMRLTRQAAPVLQRRPNRLALGLVILVAVFAALMLVTPVRARVLEWIRIGAVRIFFSQPTPTAPLPGPAGVISTPAPTPTPIESVLDLAGETSLDKAQEQVRFEIQLPAFPTDLGEPDRVYLQRYTGLAVILVWMDPDQPDQVLMSLSEAPSTQPMFDKYDPKSVLDVQVNGRQAAWIEGNYLLVMHNGEYTMTRLIDQSHTLVWSTEEMTFRLETDFDLDTAIKTAESIP